MDSASEKHTSETLAEQMKVINMSQNDAMKIQGSYTLMPASQVEYEKHMTDCADQ